MITTEERIRRYNELRKLRIHVPYLQEDDLAVIIPPSSMQDHHWLAYLWDEPSARDLQDRPFLLAPLTAKWEKSRTFVTGQLELRAEREAAVKKADADKASADVARRTQEASNTKSELRARYLSLPGTTDADFETAYPTLLDEHRRQLMNDQSAADQRARDVMRNLVRNAI